MPSPLAPIDGSMVHALSRHWKPTKTGPASTPEHEDVRIRVHRCLSWMQRVEELAAGDEEGDALDSAIIFQWVALNGLYGRWDPVQRFPVEDRVSLRAFLDRVVAADADGRVKHVLDEHRRLVSSLLEDEYLSKYFWEDPTDLRARQSKKAMFDARTWYVEGRYRLILERVLERVYLARCQLVHGAATHGSTLNRTALKRCSMMMGHLLPAMLLVIMDHVWDTRDWGDLCYPPTAG